MSTLALTVDAASHGMPPFFNLVMLAFVIPLTTVTLAVFAARSARRRFRKAA